jgi:ribokinase
MKNILVIGSSNTDMVIKTPRFPQPGETIIGGEFFMFPGGKGANQAVAAARLAGNVTFLCKVGGDIFGRQAVEGFIRENINTHFILTDEKAASGVALITVNAQGENQIVVASGANGTLTPPEIEQAHGAYEAASFVLLQLETPPQTVEMAIVKGAAMGKKVILNPAPAHPLSAAIYQYLFLITPNETEAALLTGVEVSGLASASKAATLLLEKGVQNVIITLGAEGAFFKNREHEMLLQPPKVKAVDTTAAGDVFNGAITVALAEGQDWSSAIDFACRAAAISVTRMGAQASTPYRDEIVA